MSFRAVPAVRAFASVAAANLGLPSKYGHFINGKFVEPREGKYFDNISPIDGKPFIKAARGTKADVDAAVDAANSAYKTSWSKASVTVRSNILLKIADIIEANADKLAKIETVDNGKPVRESIAADLPLVIDHFRYFAGVIRAEEGSASEIDAHTLSLCIRPSESSGRSSHGIFRCSWRPGSSRLRWLRETASCSSRPSKHPPQSWRLWTSSKRSFRLASSTS